MPNVAVKAVEVSTAEAEVLEAEAFVAVVGLAGATMVEVTATAAIAAAGEWVRCTAADDMEGWAAVRRRAALEEEEVGPRVEDLRADGRAGAGTAGT